jgi:DNA-binding IclR family transcriptional regulator
LEKLRDRTNETLLLAKRSESYAVYLDVVESTQLLHYTAAVGEKRSLHCSASGQALLGGMDPEERAKVIDSLRLEKRTARTITSRAALERKIRSGVERGWFPIVGEYDKDTAAVAVPVRMYGELYAIVLAAPRQRLEGSIDRLGRLLLTACQDVGDKQADAA